MTTASGVFREDETRVLQHLLQIQQRLGGRTELRKIFHARIHRQDFLEKPPVLRVAHRAVNDDDVFVDGDVQLRDGVQIRA